MITKTSADGKVIINIEGRVDTNNAAELQSVILSAFQESKTVEIEMAKLSYVSSAGLRSFLIGQKTASSKAGSMTLLNVNSVVMSILKTVGFDSILTIK